MLMELYKYIDTYFIVVKLEHYQLWIKCFFGVIHAGTTDEMHNQR